MYITSANKKTLKSKDVKFLKFDPTSITDRRIRLQDPLYQSSKTNK